MGKTFKRNDRWKKDRRDKHFRESKKFKDFQHDYQPRQRPNDAKSTEDAPVDDNLGNT